MTTPNEFERCLEQEFFGEGVAHLHARTLRFTCRREVFRGKRCAVNAIASRARANGNDRVPDPLGLGANQFILSQEPDAHGVDQRIAFVGGVEDHLAGHGGNPDAVAVVTDALHDARKEPTNPGRV